MSTEIESKRVDPTEGIHEKDADGYRSSDVELPIDAQVETYVPESFSFFSLLLVFPTLSSLFAIIAHFVAIAGFEVGTQSLTCFSIGISMLRNRICRKPGNWLAT